VYHAGPFKGRAEPLRLLLEDAGVAFETQNEPIHGPQGHMDAFRGSPEAVKADLSTYPVMFPPVIWHRPKDGEEVYVNQTAACLSYIGSQVGYDPQNAAERARADMITQNCTDFVSEGRGSFHPVNPKGPYKEQQEAADKASKAFTESRLLVWLQHFEKLLKRTGGAKPVAGGPKVISLGIAHHKRRSPMQTLCSSMPWMPLGHSSTQIFTRKRGTRPTFLSRRLIMHGWKADRSCRLILRRTEETLGLAIR